MLASLGAQRPLAPHLPSLSGTLDISTLPSPSPGNWSVLEQAFRIISLNPGLEMEAPNSKSCYHSWAHQP